MDNGQQLTVYPLLNATSRRLFQRTNGPGTFTRYSGLVLKLHGAVGRGLRASDAGAAPQGRLAINLAPAGDYRMPAQKLLWLRFNRALIRRGTHRLDVGAEVDNALQNQAFDAIATQTFAASNFAQPVSWVLPRRMFLSLNAYF